MKITHIEPFVIRPGLAEDEAREGAWLFIRVDTDEGLHGWGEATKYGRGGSLLLADAVLRVREDLIGEDPADIERIWHKIYRRYSYLGSRGMPTTLAAGIDIALWDIKGKATGRPVYDLLGGRFRDSIALYANSWFGGCRTPEDYATAARENVLATGNSACKLDPFLEMRPWHTMYQDGQISDRGEQGGYDIVAAVREAVGPKHEILIDAHGHYNVPTAIRLANNLFERSSIGWFEEPVPPESFQALRQVREHTAAPICVGERLFTRYDFVPVFENRLADFIMPDTIWTGGISEIRKIATMAEAYYIPVSPHCVPSGPLELLAAAHAMSTIPNFYRLEHSLASIPIHNALLDEPIDIRDGELHLNGKPGLGYDLNKAKLNAKKHPSWKG